MNKTILQVPVNTVLRSEAEKQALSQGFSSLQEAVRIFLKKLAKGTIGISFEDEEVIHLSPKAVRRYDKILRNIKNGKEKVYKAKNVEDLMLQLNS